MKEKMRITFICKTNTKVLELIHKFSEEFELKVQHELVVEEMDKVLIVHSDFWDGIPTDGRLIFGAYESVSHEMKLDGLRKFSDIFPLDSSVEEIFLRIMNFLNHMISKEHKIPLGNLYIDLENPVGHLNNEALNLTLTESKILLLLIKVHPGFIQRQEVMDYVWSSAYTSNQTLNTHLTNLRSKLIHWDYEISSQKERGIFLSKK